MFGIRGLDAFGLVHGLLGLTSLLLGAAALLVRKGTSLHRRMGFAYLCAMGLLNLTALLIYDLTGGFNGFHIAATISLATITAGYLAIRVKHAFEAHGILMGWSYVGLVAAFFAEVAVRIPGVGFSPAVMVPVLITTAVGAILIHTRIPPTAQSVIREASSRYVTPVLRD